LDEGGDAEGDAFVAAFADELLVSGFKDVERYLLAGKEGEL
jgi:hypothetical protein